MRFWLQALKMSSAVSYRFIVNDKEVTSGEVQSSVTLSHPKLTMLLQTNSLSTDLTNSKQISDAMSQNSCML